MNTDLILSHIVIESTRTNGIYRVADDVSRYIPNPLRTATLQRVLFFRRNMSVIHLLSAGNFIAVNKSLIKSIGLIPAILIGELASECLYWETQGTLVDGCWFYSTVDNINDNTGLSEHDQREGIKSLIDLGIIETKKMGVPAKRYFKLNEEILMEVVNHLSSGKQTSSSQVNGPQEVRLSRINKNKEIRITNKNKENNEKENIQKKERFVPPTVEEVRAYCLERGNTVDPENFVDFYTSKNWMVGKTKMTNWKASVRTWERNEKKKYSSYQPKPVVDEFDAILRGDHVESHNEFDDFL